MLNARGDHDIVLSVFATEPIQQMAPVRPVRYFRRASEGDEY